MSFESAGIHFLGFSIFWFYDSKTAILSRNSWKINDNSNLGFRNNDLTVEFWDLYLGTFLRLERFSPQLSSFFLAFVGPLSYRPQIKTQFQDRQKCPGKVKCFRTWCPTVIFLLFPGLKSHWNSHKNKSIKFQARGKRNVC